MFPKFTILRNNIMRKYIIKFVQKIDSFLFRDSPNSASSPQKASPNSMELQQPQYFLRERIWNQCQYQKLIREKLQSKIFCKLSNLRKSTPKVQLLFILAINIDISTQYFTTSRTLVLYLIGTCSPWDI